VAQHCDSVRVAAKRRDVVSYPLQSRQDVAHAQVPPIRFLAVRPRVRAQEPCNTDVFGLRSSDSAVSVDGT
jgi:hypothetical protein